MVPGENIHTYFYRQFKYAYMQCSDEAYSNKIHEKKKQAYSMQHNKNQSFNYGCVITQCFHFQLL